ncbi:CoA ester lyase [Burkholderia sp. BKH01]|uniref:HpcH/HpaI aldolase/citrate lyase family protein n=1 Tax=Burkholderia sp. BKH01 TaxID=2769262 RepID=UPI0021DFEB9A|nr:CoA ester lyase [Burkholderia sp. BKH01]MCU9953509.1 CoA ester lyase [Burkholderia sp. BKH01]
MSSEAAFSAQSYLFVPGNRPERFASALASGADAVIIDLEDAVEPATKVDARETVKAWVSRDRPVLVRINGRGTPWFDEDAKLVALDGIAGVVIPKTESLDEIVEVVSAARRKVPVFPLIETARGMWSAMEIAKAPYVKRLMFGTLDFIAEMGTDDDHEALNPYRAQLALISRVAGIEPPVDGVTPDIHDTDRLVADTRNGKRHGFGAKLCIHPAQIAAVHACYSPSARDVEWAMRVVDAVSRADGAATTVDGKMVDRPVLLRAQQVLASAARRNVMPAA